jgi:four helix bundle protein
VVETIAERGGTVDKNNGQFVTFEALDVYRAAREFRVSMYRVARRLPEFEKFELASQIRRAAVSLTNNIAEGHGRYHYPDQIKFMLQARGSLQELVDDLNVSSDEAYIPAVEAAALKELAWNVLKLLNGYLRWLRDRKTGEALTLHEGSVDYAVIDVDFENYLTSLPLQRDGIPSLTCEAERYDVTL